ncbi:MAG: PQQ-like beta-propeller repeat protein [archaeon]|nr:PQQ-like beta-propeller repeat protein [archaeon]
MKKKILIILLILALCISPVASAEWDFFQGDIHHTGYHKDSSDFVTNLWIFNMESPIIGSLAINGSNMYVASENGLLKCIDMSEGSEKWSVELDNKTLASPVTDNETV